MSGVDTEAQAVPRAGVDGGNTPAGAAAQPALVDAVGGGDASGSTAAQPAAPSGRPVPRIARVLPFVRVAHLDRLFDYTVGEQLAGEVQPGVMVKVRFHGSLVDAIVMETAESTDFSGKLSPIVRVVSPVVVAPRHIRTLIDEVAQHYGGMRADVYRAAIPRRHARGEQVALNNTTPWNERDAVTAVEDWSAWHRYQHGESFLAALASGRAPRALWQLSPGEDWAARIAEVATTTAAGGGGVLVIVPDIYDCEVLAAALGEFVGTAHYAVLTDAVGAQSRYRQFVEILTGGLRIVVGTRSAVFAPVANLQLIVVMDDGNDLLVDPRAPYIHARDVAVLRSRREDTALIIGGWARTAESALLAEEGFAHTLMAAPDTLAEVMPHIQATVDSDIVRERDRNAHSRLPAAVFTALRTSLEAGLPALVQVPRKGYVPAVACTKCRTPARCRRCRGPLIIRGSGPHEVLVCRWCGSEERTFRCQECGNHHVRALVKGADRTAEELGRAFPGVPVHVSSSEHRLTTIEPGARLVLATPGAAPTRVQHQVGKKSPQPPATLARYGAAVIVDTWMDLLKQDLRAEERALASWMAVAGMVVPRGPVVVVGPEDNAVVQDVMHWNPVRAAARELQGRREAQFPPVGYLAVIDGTPAAVAAYRNLLPLPPQTHYLGPVPLPQWVARPAQHPEGVECVRLIVQSTSPLGPAMRQARVRAAVEKRDIAVRVVVDPVNVG